MSISQSKYVSITSGIGGASATGRKDLILRIFTTNALFPADTILEFATYQDVANYAGSTSTEAKLAAAYFGWVSKQINSPAKISFMKYALNEATAPTLRSTSELATLATYQAITDGSMVINMGGLACTLSSLDFSSATSYSDVATVVQTALNAYTAGGELFTNASVTYDSATSSFILTGGTTGANVITYATSAGSGTDISTTIGWASATNPVISNGKDATTITDTLNTSVELSDNFASYAFLNLTLEADLIKDIGPFEWYV